MSDLWAQSDSQAQILVVVVENEPTNYGFSVLNSYIEDERVNVAVVLPSHPIAARYGGVHVPAAHFFRRTNPEQVVYSSK